MRKRVQAAIKQPSAATGGSRAQAAIKEPSAATRSLPGQAAMEFLMTYGWAILIMLVVISVLFFLGVFSPSTSTTKSCVLPAGFTCYEFDIDESGSISLDLGQSTGKSITVYGVGCSTNSSPALTTLISPVTIQSGGHGRVTGPSAGISINCSGASGSQFKGKIAIKYRPAGASYNKTVYGDVSGPLLNSSGGSGSTTDLTGVWVLVPGNPTYGTSDFYVMKYEAKQNASGNATSTAAGNPWAVIRQGEARANCTAIGAHLITVAEAQTISRDVASVGANWLSGSVGGAGNCMYGGHMQCNSTGPCYVAYNASSNDAEGWWNGTQDAHNTSAQNCPFSSGSNTWGNESRRTLYLSNGNALWDWSGNVWEYLNETCMNGSGTGYWSSSSWIQWTDASLQDYERWAMGPPDSTWNANKGIGYYIGCTADGNALIHGGDWYNGNLAGAFSLDMELVPGTLATIAGFRCAKPA